MNLESINSVNDLLEANKTPDVSEYVPTPKELETILANLLVKEGPAALIHAIQDASHKLVMFHNAVAAKQLEEGESESAAAWSRDSGKLQAIFNISDTIEF